MKNEQNLIDILTKTNTFKENKHCDLFSQNQLRKVLFQIEIIVNPYQEAIDLQGNMSFAYFISSLYFLWKVYL